MNGFDRFFRTTERGWTVPGRAKGGHRLLGGTSALFLVYFAIDPIEQLLGVT